jgi:hypothetical protein
MNETFLKHYKIPLIIKRHLKSDSIEEKVSDQLYTQYPQLFSLAFSNVKKQEIEALNISGFLYYKSILLLDELIDSKTGSKAEQLFLSNKLQEESIKLLTSVFGLDNTFWDLWSKRQQEYFKAVELEKQLALNPSYKKYQQVADLKAAFGKVAIDCLHILSKDKNQEKHNDLLQSHFHFSVALQLIDDLQDLEEDIDNNQFNWAYFQATATLQKEGYDTKALSLSELKKLIYIKAIATDIREEALAQLNKSKKFAENHAPIHWIEVIENQKKEIIQAIDKINGYKQQLISKTQLSNDFIKNCPDIKTQFNLAKNFIINHQNDNGSWFDYDTNAGLSNVWSTAFILNNISNTIFNEKTIKKAISFLKENKQEDLWGYNTSMIFDSDSTSFALISLAKNKISTSKELDLYLAQQQLKGGYSTYTNKHKLLECLNFEYTNVQGWMQEHLCVSAVSYYLMETLNLRSDFRDNIYIFLLKNQNQNGLWDSYWWTSPIYATSFIIQAYFINNTEANESIEKAIDGLLSLQQNDGSFIDNHNFKSPFYTALVIIAFCSNKIVYNEYQDKIKLALKWLLSQQTTDGAFLSTYSLQIPEASIVNPKKVKKWSKEKNHTTNIICNDFMRLFTTSTCVNALNLFITNDNK